MCIITRRGANRALEVVHGSTVRAHPARRSRPERPCTVPEWEAATRCSWE